jgi:ABC-type phosphate transport system ATPase subunit
MNGTIDLNLADIISIIGTTAAGISIYIRLNNKIIVLLAERKAAEELHKQKMDQVEEEFAYIKENLKSLKGMVYQQNQELTKALHENSSAIRELKITMDYIREDKK